MTTSHWNRRDSFRNPDMNTDIVIVGGGYAGLSTAYWLTEMRPDLKIVILERNHCGAGASGRNAGFLTIGSSYFYKSLTHKWGKENALLIQQFAKESLELLNQHILKSFSEINSERTSSLTLFKNEEQYREWRSELFDPVEFNFEWKDNQALPVKIQSQFYGAFEFTPEYKVNPLQLLHTLRKLLEQRKVQIVESSFAFSLTHEGVQTELNFIKAKQVVLALNGYFSQFNQVFKNEIVPYRAQMMAVELKEDFNFPHLYYDPQERVYWRKTQGRILVIGGKRLLDQVGETGDFEKVSVPIQNGLEKYLNDVLGISYQVINRWSGIMGFTEHELPLISSIEAPLECYIIGGFSGHGMGLGFKSGKEMAELITGKIKKSFFNQFKKVDFKL